MKTSARYLISKIKDNFISLESSKIMETIRQLVEDNKTIYFYLEKAKGKKAQKQYIFHEILSNLFSFLIDLYLKYEHDTLEEIAEKSRKKFIDNNKIDNTLTDSLINVQKKESFGLFIVNMLKNLSETEYQKIFIDVIEKKPKKEISNALVTYFFSLDLPHVEKLNKIFIFLQNERLTLFTLSLLENIAQIKNIENSKRIKTIEIASKIINIMDNIYGEDIHFYLPVFLGYVTGLFDEVGMENIKSAIGESVEKHKEYKEVIELAIKHSKNVSQKIDKILQERDKIIEEKEKKRDKYWELRFDENKVLTATYLCEVISRLYQLKDDAEKQNVDKESSLYQRIAVTISYLEGILKLFGVNIFGQPGDILEFNHEIHESKDGKNISGQVRILIPGFIFKGNSGKEKILKKSIVSFTKEGSK